MRKLAAILAASTILASGAASAQTTTFLSTQTLNPGEVDFQATYYYDYTKRDFRTPDGTTGKKIVESFSSDYELGIGLFPRTELRILVPYTFHERTKIRALDFNSRLDGVGDVTVGTRINLNADEKLLVTTGVDVKFDTAKQEAGSGTVDAMPFLGISSRVGNLKPYISYQAAIRSDNAPATHTGVIGTEVELAKHLIIDASLAGEFSTSGAGVSSQRRGIFELLGIIGITDNIWIIPGFVLHVDSRYDEFINKPVEEPVGWIRNDHTVGYGGNIALYVTF